MSDKDLFGNLDEAINNILPILGRLFAQLWNHAMRLCIGLSLMPFLRKQPWVFVGVIIVAMAVCLPVGLVFLAAGFVALNKGVKAENDFIVDPEPKPKY